MTDADHVKVLVIRFSSIGDIVLTTPVLRCLKKIPGKEVEVHVVTKKAYSSILEDNPYVDRLHLLDGRLTGLIKQLRAADIDCIIDLHHNIRSALVKLALRKPAGSFLKLNLEKWLLTRFKVNRLPPRHIVDRYFEAAAIAGVENDGEGLDFFFSRKPVHLYDGLPVSFNKDLVTFVIGGKHATKRLPNDKIISICRKLPGNIVLLGGKEDEANGRTIESACGEHVFNGCGLFSLQQSASLVKKARLVISHDTGLMHIAAAFNKYLVSVWGNTIPGFGMFPYMPKYPERSIIVEVEGLPCRPCTKIGYTKCPKGHFDCMMRIDEEKIVQNARHILMNNKAAAE